MPIIDWGIVFFYALGIFLLSRAARGKLQSGDDFFRAGRSLAILPVCLSIIATETSAATFVGTPDTAYRTNILFLQTAFGTLLSRPAIALLFLDRYYVHDVSTVYQYIRHSFGWRVEKCVSLLFLIGRVLGSAARLFIASYALSLIADTNLELTIIAVGISSMLYASVGGLRAVVWTDVFQSVLFMTAGIGSLVYLSFHIEWADGVQVLNEHSKLQLFDLDFGLSRAEFWAKPYTSIAAILGGFFLGLATHATDQDMVQRMLACKSSREAKRSLLGAALLEVLVSVLFISIGICLWLYFRQIGSAGPDAYESAFPFFIRHFVPSGIKGLLVAALLAAAMSSLDSAVTALASVSVYNLSLKSLESSLVRRGQLWSIIWGALLTVVALYLAEYQRDLIAHSVELGSDVSRQSELLTLALGLMASLYGPILGVFLLARVWSRLSDTEGLFALAVGILTAIALRNEWPISFGWTWHIVLCTLATLSAGAFVQCGRKTLPWFDCHSY